LYPWSTLKLQITLQYKKFDNLTELGCQFFKSMHKENTQMWSLKQKQACTQNHDPFTWHNIS